MSEEQPKKKSIFSELSVPQILAGALSAITVAFALSKMGVSGTLIGAGIGSILGTFGTTLYSRSLDQSTVLVKKVAAKPVAAAAKKGQPSDDETRLLPPQDGEKPEEPENEESSQQEQDLHDTQEIPVIPPSFATQTEEGNPVKVKTLDETTIRIPWYRRINWRGTIVLAGVSLALAMGILSLYESKTGATLSGEEGTTIQRVIVYRDSPAAEPTPAPTIIYLPSEEPADEEPEQRYPQYSEEDESDNEVGGTTSNTGESGENSSRENQDRNNAPSGGGQEEQKTPKDDTGTTPVAPRPNPEPSPSPEPTPAPEQPADPVNPEPAPEDPAPVEPPPASNPKPGPGTGNPDPSTGNQNIQLGG